MNDRPRKHIPTADEIPDCKANGRQKGFDVMTVRQSLPSVEAMQKYDNYLRDHAKRLRQLIKVAAGELSPGEDWYNEKL